MSGRGDAHAGYVQRARPNPRHFAKRRSPGGASHNAAAGRRHAGGRRAHDAPSPGTGKNASSSATQQGGAGVNGLSSRALDEVSATISDEQAGSMAKRMVSNPRAISWRHNPMKSILRHRQRVNDVLMPQHRGIPVRDLVQATFKLFRDARIVDAIVFSLYFSLFLSILYLSFEVHLAFTTDDAMMDLFLDEEFEGAPYKQNFDEVMTHDEFWTWMRGPLVNGLYTDEWYNGDPFTEAQKGYLGYHLRLVGGAQLRQLRVSNHSCLERRFVHMTAVHNGQVLGKYDSKDGTCFDFFEESLADTEPFGPPANPSKYKHTSGLVQVDGLFGFGPSYGTGGYVVELPLDEVQGRAAVEELFRDRWTDRGTRAVVVSFNLYNTNTRLVTVVRVLFEFFPDGHLVKSAKFFTVKMAMYQTAKDMFRLVLEVFYIGFFVFYLCRQLYELRWMHEKMLFFTRFSNIYDLLLLAANAMFIASWIVFLAEPVRYSFDVNNEHFVDMFALASKFVWSYTWAAIVGLLGFLKIFQFLGISKNMNALWMTLARAGPDLATFLVGFLLVSVGFAFTANLLFGPYLAEYHRVSTAFNTLLRVPLGDMDYAALAQARPSLAPAFFTVYVVLIFLIILNMFVGIVTKYFNDVHQEIKQQDFWKSSALSWEGERMLAARATYMYCRMRSPCKPRIRNDQLELEASHARLVATRERRAQFMAKLQVAARLAKRNNNILMFEYFEGLLNENRTKNMFICVNEICGMVRDSPCDTHSDCEAAQLVTAYQRLKTVMLMGVTKKYVPITSEAAMTYQMFEVLKFSSSGLAVPRRLSVNTENGTVLNFSKTMRLLQRLPITDLISLEMDRCDPRRLVLRFSSSDRGVTQDSLYDVLFEDALNRHMFVSRALESHALSMGLPPEAGTRVLQKPDDKGGGDGGSGGGGDGPGNRMRRGSRRTERESFLKFMESQGSSGKLFSDGSDDGGRSSPSSTSTDRTRSNSAQRRISIALGVDIAELEKAQDRADVQRMQAIELVRDKHRSLSERLTKTAQREDLHLNSADMALLASLQQELARAKRTLKQSGRVVGRRASLAGNSAIHQRALKALVADAAKARATASSSQRSLASVGEAAAAASGTTAGLRTTQEQ